MGRRYVHYFYFNTILSLYHHLTHYYYSFLVPLSPTGETDYDDDDDDSLRRDWHREGGSGNNTGRIRGLLWGERGRSYIIISILLTYYHLTHYYSHFLLLLSFNN